MKRVFLFFLCIVMIFCLVACSAKSCEHIFSEMSKIAATCTEEGFIQYVCDMCGEEKTESIPKLEHTFGNAEVIKEATCSNNGEEKQVCKTCGYEQINKIDILPHDYVNKACSVCGEKEPAEKSDLEANTWYTYKGGVLHIQNCLVANAGPAKQGKAMTVLYYAVCQHCHAIDESSKLAGPEVDYEVEKISYCNECGGQTIVRLKID